MSIDSSLIDNNVKHKPTHYDGLATADVRLSRLSKLSKEHKSERFVHPFPYALLFFARVRTLALQLCYMPSCGVCLLRWYSVETAKIRPQLLWNANRKPYQAFEWYHFQWSWTILSDLANFFNDTKNRAASLRPLNFLSNNIKAV